MRRLLITILSFFVLLSTSYAAEQFKVDQDYKIIPPSPLAPKLISGEVQVYEFFSYGCPWCFRFESVLEPWLKQKSAKVKFNRIPVVFESGWDMYAKAYYIAEAFDITDKTTMPIFNAIHVQRRNLKKTDIAALFEVKADVAVSKFIAAFNSPSIDIQLKKGKELMGAFQVYGVPALVINNKYRTDMALAKGDSQRLMDITKFLIKKSRRENNV